jgi:hypothetical protein
MPPPRLPSCRSGPVGRPPVGAGDGGSSAKARPKGEGGNPPPSRTADGVGGGQKRRGGGATSCPPPLPYAISWIDKFLCLVTLRICPQLDAILPTVTFLSIVFIGAARIVRMRMAFRQNRPWLAHCSCQTSVHDLNLSSQAPLFPSASKILCDALHLPVIMGLREANRSNLFP